MVTGTDTVSRKLPSIEGVSEPACVAVWSHRTRRLQAIQGSAYKMSLYVGITLQADSPEPNIHTLGTELALAQSIHILTATLGSIS